MRATVILLVAAMAFLGPGCFLIDQATQVLVSGASRSIEEFAERCRNHRWADDAWRTVRDSAGPEAFSEDYGDGFREGFAEFLFQGGNGEPPPLPPRHYRKLRYQSAHGYRAIEDWFAGYRHGATLAKEGGYRQLITGPTALLSTPLLLSPSSSLFHAEPPVEMAPIPRLYLKAIMPSAEELPEPRSEKAEPKAARERSPTEMFRLQLRPTRPTSAETE